jgi:iron complex outermembrane receptor protein
MISIQIVPATGLQRLAALRRVATNLTVLMLGAAVVRPVAAEQDEPAPLEEIVVTASMRREPLAEFPVSTSVLDAATIESAGMRHFEDAMKLVPNLNWSGATSRPRYFQIRGIGELEQYQGAPNASVGFLIDEIDFSGIGMAATLWDVGQVEVLRGPQGTRFGANALAGLIKIKTRDPDGTRDFRSELVAGEDRNFGAGVAAGGPIGADGALAAWRASAYWSEANGFRHNDYLGRDDTNGRQELTLRGKIQTRPNEAWRLGLNVSYADLDNGFDVFAPDNSLHTLSDRPGRDAQQSLGIALAADVDFQQSQLQSVTTLADSDILYSFDGDWGNDDYWGEYAPYDYFSRYERGRRSWTQDLRLVSNSTADSGGFGWIAGAYASRLDEDNRQSDYFAAELLRAPLTSEYTALRIAGYGELEWLLGQSLVASGGLRVERWSAEYRDSDSSAFEPVETMTGGHLSLRGPVSGALSWYATLSRGYKAGGFNIGRFVPEDRRDFSPEYLWNLEAGMRYASVQSGLDGSLSVFQMWREDQQVATSFQLDPGDPLSYVFYTDNAARGRNYGLEAQVDWQPPAIQELAFSATLGLLRSEYIGYRYGERDLDGREQAHAPGWQYSVSAEWQNDRGWTARADIAGVDAFYFDAAHDQRSDPYTLVHVRAGYSGERWSAFLWGRNVFDEEYAVRGFYFGLEPPDYAEKLYIQRGDPRHFGLTIEWRLN